MAIWSIRTAALSNWDMSVAVSSGFVSQAATTSTGNAREPLRRSQRHDGERCHDRRSISDNLDLGCRFVRGDHLRDSGEFDHRWIVIGGTKATSRISRDEFVA